ncbi:conidiation protein 6 [Wilcoxina mikolae CBS 423.85]|nr:conidiation protein 6 [Wilcoxina mikolae CBS 423.85]
MTNPGNIIGGHKANLHNPNTSEESKQHSKEVLEKEFGGGDTGKYSAAGSHGGTKNSRNVEGGLKATMKNPNTSEEAKMHAKERLESGDL